MTRIYILVEGQTEEAFLRELLVPHFAHKGYYLTPIIVSTSPGYKGGVVSYAKIKPQIMRLCLRDKNAYVSTMFDLYALPPDFPSKSSLTYPKTASGQQKVHFLENQLSKDINQPNFISYLMLHEYEALLFTQPSAFSQWSDNVVLIKKLQQALLHAGSPENINDGPQTAPSKRILALMPEYQKTFHGPLIACDIGLDAIRNACPHFNEWLQKIEQLGI